MHDEAVAAAVLIGGLVGELGYALIEVEESLPAADRYGLRDLVAALGWWSGRLSASAEASGVRGAG